MLELAARTAMMDEEPLRDGSRERSAKIVLDHAKCKIETSARSSRRPDRSVRDEDAILFHSDFRKTISKVPNKLANASSRLPSSTPASARKNAPVHIETDSSTHWE
jgi:hypothetical protein